MADLMTALRNADEAGDTEAASRIAAMIKQQSATAAPAPAVAAPARTAEDVLKEHFEPSDFTKSFASTPYRLTKSIMQMVGAGEHVPEIVSRYAEEGNKSTAGRAAGDFAATAVPMNIVGQLKAPLTAAKGILPNIGRIGATAAEQGAYGAALSPDNQENAAIDSALVGGALQAVSPIVGGVTRFGNRLFEGVPDKAARYLQDMFGDRAARAAADLRALRGEFPGENLTAGRAATPSTPELKALETRARAGEQGWRFGPIDEANEAARARGLTELAYPGQRFGGQLSEAEARRAAVTAPLYAGAEMDRIALNPELQQIVAGVEAQPAFRRAGNSFMQGQTNANVAGRQFPARETAAEVPPVLRDTSTGATMQEAGPFMPQPATRSVVELQRARQYLDADIEALRRSGADQNRLRQLQEARAQLSREMEQQSGMFATANTIFRNFSQPQNQAEVAETILGALRNPSMQERPGAVLTALSDQPRLLRKSDQSARFEDIGQVFTPQQMQETIRPLQRAMVREQSYANIQAPSSMLPGNRGLMTQVGQEAPGLLKASISVAKRVFSRLGKTSDERMLNYVDEAMTNPGRVADILERIPHQQREAFLYAIGRATIPLTAATVRN